MKQKIKLFLSILLVVTALGTIDLHAQDGPSSYYKTNPTLGKKVTTGIIADGNPQEWTADMIIAQGVANDDARTFRGPHESPIYDVYQLYGAWDSTNLYLMWQIVNVADIVSPEQGYPNSDNGKPWNGNVPFQLAFDIDPAKGSNGLLTGKTVEGVKGSHVWDIYNVFDNKEVDHLLMFSSKPKVGQPAVFSLNSVGEFDNANAKLFNTLGITYQWGDYSVPAAIYGVNSDGNKGYKVADLAVETKYVDFNTKGHKKTFDTVYEMTIPLTALGIDAAYLESTGIGVMLISTFGQSGMSSIPFDPATLDNAEKEYSVDTSTTKEKEDVDHFSSKFARIGKSGGVVIVRPTVDVNPKGGTFIGGTQVTITSAGDNPPITLRYTLDGTTPTITSPTIASGGKVTIPATNTTLKVIAIDGKGVSSYVSTNTYITEASKPGIKVGFKNTANWADVYIYAWEGTNTELFGAWPGKSMSKVSTDWYATDFDAKNTKFNIVINNNGKGLKAGAKDLIDITASVCYDATGTVISCGNLSIEDVNSPLSEIQIFPNPVKNKLFINTNEKVNSVSVIALSGQISTTLKSEIEKGIDMDQFPSGVYIVQINLENGQKIVKKIVKK